MATRASSSRSEPRFPFPSLPVGWFVVASSEDIPAGEIVALRYFARDLIAYREGDGTVRVSDAYCPHLGAHLAHGGTVEGDCVRCPFHGWRFDGEGKCVEVPYAERIPPKAKLKAWPTREQDGVVFVFYTPEGQPAIEPWPLPSFREARGIEWMEGKLIHWQGLRTHAQEIFENTVDITHIAPVHGGKEARLLGDPRRDGCKLTIELEFHAPGDVVGMPGSLNDVHLHVAMIGLGSVVVHTHVRNVDVHACQRIYVTPVEEDTVDIRGIVHVKPTDDAEFSEELSEVFYQAYVSDFALDFPIWENKKYLLRPALAKGDGPVGLFRRWCAQFYAADEVSKTGKTNPSEEPAAEIDVPSSSLTRVFSSLRQKAAVVRARLRRGQHQDAPGRSGEGAPAAATPKPQPKPKPKPAVTLPVTSVQDYVDTLPQRFVPAAAAGVRAVFQWELGGEQARTFHVCVADGELEVVEGAHDKPTTSLVIAADDYIKVINGELDGVRVFTSGRGKVKGSVRAAMKMRALFPA